MSPAEFQSRILTVNFFLKSATTFIKNTGAVDLQKKLAHAVRDWVFTNTDYNEIYSCMKYTNAGSYSTAIAIGMRKVKEYLDPKTMFPVPIPSSVQTGKKSRGICKVLQ